MESIRNFIFEYANLIVLVPLLLWFMVPAPRNAVRKVIFVFLLLSAFTQLVSFIFWKLHRNNLPLLHIYTLLELFVLLRLFALVLGKYSGRMLLFVGVACTAFAVWDALYLESIFTHNTYTRTIEALIIITLCIAWFMKAVSLDDTEKQEYIGMNITVSGFLIYFAGAITLFAYSSLLRNMTLDARINVWTLHTLLAVQLYILIAIGLWKTKTK